MNNTIFVCDTSFVFALLVENDMHHNLAIEKYAHIYDTVQSASFILNDFILFELITLLTYRVGFRDAKDLLVKLDILGFHQLTGVLTQEYIDQFVEVGKKMSIQDVSVVYDGLVLDAEILTYDTQQNAIYQSLRQQV